MKKKIKNNNNILLLSRHDTLYNFIICLDSGSLYEQVNN